MGGAKIRNLIVRGTIARFDFCDTTFEDCTFDRVGWVNCRFNSETKFIRCRWFGGVPPVQCEGLGSVYLIDPTQDPEAEAVFNAARVAEGRKKYASDDLRMDVRAVIGKFVIKGGLGLKTLEAGNLSRGPISASPHKDEIISVLKSVILEEHHISGATAGYHIRKECAEAVKFYAANNVFTGCLREAFEKLERKLGLT